MSVRPVPAGYSTITPHLVVKGAADSIAFYEKAFGAEEVSRHEAGGTFMHGALRIGDSMLMLADEFPDQGCLAPDPNRPSPVTIHLFVDDVDALFERATTAGAEAKMPPTDMFWGDRYAVVRDPYGHSWSIATRKEDLSGDEITERAAAAFGGGGC